jgi:hypothetical protein
MTDNTLEIITPPGMFGPSADDDLLDTALRVIGVAFGDPAEWASKYGTNFENDVFMMHRYLAEYDFRYNEREANGVNDAERTLRALSGIVGKRLKYRDSLAPALAFGE